MGCGKLIGFMFLLFGCLLIGGGFLRLVNAGDVNIFVFMIGLLLIGVGAIFHYGEAATVRTRPRSNSVECPHCFEPIDRRATVCPHCRSQLSAKATSEDIRRRESREERQRQVKDAIAEQDYVNRVRERRRREFGN